MSLKDIQKLIKQSKEGAKILNKQVSSFDGIMNQMIGALDGEQKEKIILLKRDVNKILSKAKNGESFKEDFDKLSKKWESQR